MITVSAPSTVSTSASIVSTISGVFVNAPTSTTISNTLRTPSVIVLTLISASFGFVTVASSAKILVITSTAVSITFSDTGVLAAFTIVAIAFTALFILMSVAFAKSTRATSSNVSPSARPKTSSFSISSIAV